MKRWIAALGLLIAGCFSACAGSMTLLGAGKAGGAAPPADCSAFLPAAFSGSNLYISWTTADGLGSFGMACLNGTSAVAASTLGTFVAGAGSASASSAGLNLSSGGSFQFTNLTWLTQSNGTIYANANITTISGTQAIFLITDGPQTNQEAMRLQIGTLRTSSIVAGTPTSLNTAFAPNGGVAFKIALSYTSGLQIVCVNGANNVTGAGAGSVTGLNAAILGLSPTGFNPFTGTITETAFFSTALASTAACNTLTTP